MWVSVFTTDQPKSKKFDWARSQNGYFDKFAKDMRHQIVIIIDILYNYAI